MNHQIHWRTTKCHFLYGFPLDYLEWKLRLLPGCVCVFVGVCTCDGKGSSGRRLGWETGKSTEDFCSMRAQLCFSLGLASPLPNNIATPKNKPPLSARKPGKGLYRSRCAQWRRRSDGLNHVISRVATNSVFPSGPYSQLPLEILIGRSTEQLRLLQSETALFLLVCKHLAFPLLHSAKVITILPSISRLSKICWKHLWQMVSNSLWYYYFGFRKFLDCHFNEIG